MARTSIDCEVFGGRRLERVAGAMKWSKREALGTLAFLWHESQAAKRDSGTFEEIVEWSWLGEDEEEAHRWIRALVFARLIHEDSGRYVIHGNDGHIAALESYETRGRRGGKVKAENLAAARAQLAAARKIVAPASEILAGPSCTLAARSCALPIHSFIHSDTLPADPPDGGEGEAVHKPSYEPVDIDLADEWSAYAKEVSTTVKVKREAWADVFRKLRTINKLTPEDIRAMLAFVRSDGFYRTLAASPMSLRDRSENGLLKFENIRAKMNRNSNGAAKAGPPERKPRRFDRLEDIP